MQCSGRDWLSVHSVQSISGVPVHRPSVPSSWGCHWLAGTGELLLRGATQASLRAHHQAWHPCRKCCHALRCCHQVQRKGLFRTSSANLVGSYCPCGKDAQSRNSVLSQLLHCIGVGSAHCHYNHSFSRLEGLGYCNFSYKIVKETSESFWCSWITTVPMLTLTCMLASNVSL